MAWGGNQVKRHSILSCRGNASSHGKGCLFVVLLPPSAIVFLFKLLGEWIFFNPIFSLPMRLWTVYFWEAFWNHRVEPDTRSEEEPSFCREQVGTEEVELPSI